MKTFKTPKGTELPLMDLRGKDYMMCAFRLVWFRETHPDWTIETKVEPQKDCCLATAWIKDPSGRTISMAHKFEDRQGFQDFIEKSETSAVGRALAMAGFATQFCLPDLDEGERLADSPISPKVAPRSAPVDVPRHPLAGSEDFTSQADNAPSWVIESDGAPVYRIPFGKKYKGMTLEEVGQYDLRSFVEYLEKDSADKNKPLGLQAADFVEKASAFIARFERG